MATKARQPVQAAVLDSNEASQPLTPLRTVVQAGKLITWIAGFGAAVATIVGWVQLANTLVNPYQSDYQLLKRLGTSLASDHFDAVLGPPAVSFDIAAGFGQINRGNVYLQEGYIVSTVSTADGSVVLYTVLSCDPAFQPEITTPAGSVVKLNDAPLESADTSDQGPAVISVFTGGTVSTPKHLTEVMLPSGLAGTGYRGYGLGISELCVDGLWRLAPFSGDPSDLEPAAAAFRHDHAANFYVESGSGMPLIEDNLAWVVPGGEEIPPGYLSDVLGPDRRLNPVSTNG